MQRPRLGPRRRPRRIVWQRGRNACKGENLPTRRRGVETEQDRGPTPTRSPTVATHPTRTTDQDTSGHHHPRHRQREGTSQHPTTIHREVTDGHPTRDPNTNRDDSTLQTPYLSQDHRTSPCPRTTRLWQTSQKWTASPAHCRLERGSPSSVQALMTVTSDRRVAPAASNTSQPTTAGSLATNKEQNTRADESPLEEPLPIRKGKNCFWLF